MNNIRNEEDIKFNLLDEQNLIKITLTINYTINNKTDT